MRALVDARSGTELFEGLLDFREAEAFRIPEAKKAAEVRAVLEQIEGPFAQRIVEVDEHVPAQHKLHFTEEAVHGEVVAAKGDSIAHITTHDGRARARREVLSEAALTSGRCKALAALAHHGQGVNAALSGA